MFGVAEERIVRENLNRIDRFVYVLFWKSSCTWRKYCTEEHGYKNENLGLSLWLKYESKYFNKIAFSCLHGCISFMSTACIFKNINFVPPPIEYHILLLLLS